MRAAKEVAKHGGDTLAYIQTLLIFTVSFEESMNTVVYKC
jgi:hypothetical protein